MANSLYNELNNVRNNMFNRGYQQPPRNNVMNIMAQLRQVQQDPGTILDIMLQNGKISQQQYQEMQPIRNNLPAIGQYLINHGYANEISQAQQQINNINNNSVN